MRGLVQLRLDAGRGWFEDVHVRAQVAATRNDRVKPVSGTNRWAVSQAASFRRMHVKGGLNLAPNG